MRKVCVAIVILIILCIFYIISQNNSVKYDNVEGLEGIPYKVAALKDRDQAALILDELNEYCLTVMRCLKTDVVSGKHFGSKQYCIDNLLERYNPLVIKENTPAQPDTSYTVNKGQELYLCIRDSNYNFHEMPLLKFVLLHEMSHILSNTYAHDKAFWGNFAWLLHYCHKKGLYTPTDYRKHPLWYCKKLYLDSNPFYDEPVTAPI